MRNRIKYSQNFLKDKKLINNLLEMSSIQENDIVYEIGTGEGIITEELLKKKVKVVAFEVDANLFNKLEIRFQSEKSLQLNQGDFLNSQLPNQQYKVFSNIPFNITSSIIKKLTFSNNPPEDTYLIIQKEAANKFIGKPFDKNNSLLSILIASQFELTIFHEFQRTDFFPMPNIDVVMIRIQKLKNAYISSKDKSLFFDFVTYTYNQFKPNILKGLNKVIKSNKLIALAKKNEFSANLKPSELDFPHWLVLFDEFLKTQNDIQQKLIQGSFNKLQLQQKSLQKINRTRKDKNWKNAEK